MLSAKLVTVIETTRLFDCDPLTGHKMKIVEFWSTDGKLLARDEQRVNTGEIPIENPLTEN